MERLRALDAKARRKGVGALDAALNPLIGIGMETGPGGRVSRNCYGILHLPWVAAKEKDWPARVQGELAGFREGLERQPRFVVWCGFSPEIEAQSAAKANSRLPHFVIDSSAPGKMEAALAALAAKCRGSIAAALRAALVIGVEGGAEAALILGRLARAFESHGVDCAGHFVTIAPAGSPAARLAGARSFALLPPQLDGADTLPGWSRGPLTRAGLYRLGLSGIDLKDWVAACDLNHAQVTTALRLAAFLDEQGRAGRDKVTLQMSPSLAQAAGWTRETLETALGKDAKQGLQVVTGETPLLRRYRTAADPRQNRVFLLVERQREPALERRKADLLRRAGYPVATVRLDKAAPLAAWMQTVHYLAFGLAWLRGTSLAGAPAVSECEAKAAVAHQNAQFQGGMEQSAEWKQMLAAPRQIRWRGGIALHYDRFRVAAPMEGRDASAAWAALARQLALAGVARCGALVCFFDTRLSREGRKLRRVLERAAVEIFHEGLSMPGMVCEAPGDSRGWLERSAGQGDCFSTLIAVRASGPGEATGADYQRARLLAALEVQEQRARPVVTVTLKDLSVASADALGEFFSSAARRLKREGACGWC
jgi:hypothetical protein